MASMFEVWDPDGEIPLTVEWNGVKILLGKLEVQLPKRTMILNGDVWTVLPELEWPDK